MCVCVCVCVCRACQDGRRLYGDADGMLLEYGDDGRCSLTIDRVRVEHEAEYVCKATNQHGTASTFAEILVESAYYTSRLLTCSLAVCLRSGCNIFRRPIFTAS